MELLLNDYVFRLVMLLAVVGDVLLLRALAVLIGSKVSHKNYGKKAIVLSASGALAELPTLLLIFYWLTEITTG